MFQNNKLFNKGIKLKETKFCFFIENIFPPNIISGFTKSLLPGKLPDDFNKVISYIGKKSNFSYMNQRHSASLALVQKPGLYHADGLFTKHRGHFLAVKTADCLPLLLANEDVIGVIHMGWRSAEKGILKNISFDLTDFKVAAGLGLRSCCYQVGNEFREFGEFSSYLRTTSKGVFFQPIRFARDQLIAKGLKKDNFFDLSLCSYCLRRDFFSYRGSKTGKRNLSFIGFR
ncbi:MAG: polyphenol oxidase family protein [Candidatus Omnitrophica bacterium]|nr:polyphenol oxidase family protein [Candidatus Omnitrophota bacterium]MCF7876933.1 polyphenol oxidase family protein [Candidatus Omnitrophota bacterium]MCF7878613.1 polyphenol oxidase family protein [Candidatus Omnitrophota bacterium]MCF7893066.1 polyphenol oxidase family protein [Candidatus Omnitrophota bacterium]